MIIEKIAEMLADKIGCEPGEITGDTAFETLGIDSLDVTELVMNLEEEYGFEIELTESLKTVGDLVALIESVKKQQ